MKEFKLNEIDEAIDKAWELKECILLYPEEMNLIVVDKEREEHSYLSHTIIIDSNCFDSKEEFVECIKSM